MDRFGTAWIVLEPEFELATSDMIVQFAIRNMGISCVMEEFAKGEDRERELFEPRLPGDDAGARDLRRDG